MYSSIQGPTLLAAPQCACPFVDMNWTTAPFPSSSSQGSTSQEDETNAETATYLSPVHASSYRPECSQPLIGLGLSFYEVETPFGRPGLYQPTETSSLAVAEWSCPMGLPEPFSEPTLDVGSFVPAVNLESYPDCTDACASPYGLYSTQAMTRTPRYRARHDASLGLPSATWQTTFLGDNSPSSLGEIKELENFQEQPFFANGLNTTEAPLLSQEPPFPVDNTFPGLSPRDLGDVLSPNLKMGRDVGRSCGTKFRNTYGKTNPRSNPVDTPSPRRKLSPENSRKCDLCDFTFTRTSNCRDHMKKKHSPDGTKSHFCDICEQSFRRRHDLIRHVDCVMICGFWG